MVAQEKAAPVQQTTNGNTAVLLKELCDEMVKDNVPPKWTHRVLGIMQNLNALQI